MTITADSSLREVAFLVCTALDRAGVTAVLTGGNAAGLYAPAAVQSFDLDFVITLHASTANSAEVLERLGYTRVGHDYKHSESPHVLEFPKGPLAIGDELIQSWNTIREGELVLHVLTPTDSCRDRLAAYYHFVDRAALEQALAVHAAQTERIDLSTIRRWSKREGRELDYREFVRRIERDSSS